MTKKYVLTGGPSCGKTTLLDALEVRGYNILKEVARGVLKEREDKPLNYNEHLTRQKLIFGLQVEQEKNLEGEVAFLDRGIIDNFAYQVHLLCGIIPEYAELAKKHPMYDQVFVLDRLPFENDGLRIEKDDSEAQELHDSIIHFYQSFGYSPVFVPVMGIEARVDFILDHIGEKR